MVKFEKKFGGEKVRAGRVIGNPSGRGESLRKKEKRFCGLCVHWIEGAGNSFGFAEKKGLGRIDGCPGNQRWKRGGKQVKVDAIKQVTD